MLAKKPFVIIDAEILSSTIWDETPATKIVWFTLLILCDTDGVVGAAIPGIARAAGVSREEAQIAMDRFVGPDPDSRTETDEGRRCEKVDRGWRILNFRAHIDRMSSEKAKTRDRVRRFRERRRAGVTVTPGNVTVPVGSREKVTGNREKTSTDAPAVADAESQALNPGDVAGTTDTDRTEGNVNGHDDHGGGPTGWSTAAATTYLRHYPKATVPAPLFKFIKPLVKKHGWIAVEAQLEAYLLQTEVQYHNWSKFASGFGSWGETGIVVAGKAQPKRFLSVAERNIATIAKRRAERGGSE